jgi:site-specific DNA recombinase
MKRHYPLPHGLPGRYTKTCRSIRISVQTVDRKPSNLPTSRAGPTRSQESGTLQRGHLYGLLSNPIYTGQIAQKGELYPGLHRALIDNETWTAVRNQLAANTNDHRRKAKAAEPSLLAGLLVDVRGERFTPSHAIKNGRRYRYYVSAALISEAGTDRAQGRRIGAQEIEEAVVRILIEGLTSPAKLVERIGTAGMASDQIRKMLGRAARLAAALSDSLGERATLVRELVEKVVVDDQSLTIKLRCGPLLGGVSRHPHRRTDVTMLSS